MSRTDVHRPYAVQATDPYNRHRGYRFQTWATEEPKWVPLYNICGCNLCTGQLGRRWQHRQERCAWRKVRQQLIKTQTADREDMDGYTPVIPHW